MVRFTTPVTGKCDSLLQDLYVDGKYVELSLWDTAGQEEFDRLRSLSYDNTHAIMLCFSVDSPQSLENVETKWKNEIEENCPGVKIVLVALKCDLRESQDDEDENPQEPKRPMIEYKQGLQVAQNIKALRYLGVYIPISNKAIHADIVRRMLRNEESWG